MAADPDNAAAGERRVLVDGREWIVRTGGNGLAGTGARGLAPVEAVHFYRPGEDRPRFEALVGRGTWLRAFDDELAALLATAVPVPEGPAPGGS